MHYQNSGSLEVTCSLKVLFSCLHKHEYSDSDIC